MDIDPTLVAALRRTVSGRVVYPADPTYDALVARSADPGARPIAVVVAAHADDVLAAVRLAREHRVPVGMADGALAVVEGITLSP
jgi:FAD/FMN-containing dehydrogenase